MSKSESRAQGTFALIGPPADAKHLYQILDWYRQGEKRFSSDMTLLKLLQWLPPYKAVDFPSIPSATGTSVRGFHVMCPILPEMVSAVGDASSFRDHVFRRVLESCKIAADEGATVASLGAFSSIAVVGREGEISREAGIAVTSGNTFTTWLAMEGVKRAAELVGLDLGTAKAAVLGASGDIGRGCCRSLGRAVSSLTLTARNLPRLEQFADELRLESSATVEVTGDNSAAARNADIIVAAAISPKPLIRSEDVKPGAVVCDVGYPKNVSKELEKRSDVFAYSGGLTAPPFVMEFGFESKLPSPEVLYGCFSESIILAMEGRSENYSTGRGGITVEKMQEIGAAATKHGFRVAPYYSGDRLLTEEQIAGARRGR